MTRLALAVIVAAAGVTTVVHRHHQHRTPTAASALTSWPLRASRAHERQPLPGVHARMTGEGVTPQLRRAPVRRGPSRPAPGSGLHNWGAVAACESSGDWHANTGNGYYGGLQFLLSTWRSFGGHGRPDQASETEQIRIAERVLAVQGPRAWPNCGRFL